MKMKQLTKVEQTIILACVQTVRSYVTEDKSGHAAKLEAEMNPLGIDIKEELQNLDALLQKGPLLLLDKEGEEVPGEVKIVEMPLAEYGQPNPFKNLKGMKFPYRKEASGEQPN